MQHLQSEKQTILLAPATVTNGATATANLDCKGHNAVDITVQIGTFNGGTSGAAPLVCKLSESDDTVVTNFADISGASAASALTDSGNVRFNVDLTKRKRYIKLSFSPATASTNSSVPVSAIARFDRSDTEPSSTSGFGDTIVKVV